MDKNRTVEESSHIDNTWYGNTVDEKVKVLDLLSRCY